MAAGWPPGGLTTDREVACSMGSLSGSDAKPG